MECLGGLAIVWEAIYILLMSMIGIECWKSGKVCYNHLADPENLHDDDSKCFSYCNPLKCIEFLNQQPVFKEHM